MSRTGAETRALLVETALRLFRDAGYERTTMRRIAAEAGVSLGNAYHYFDGKDALVHELYRRIQDEHRARALPAVVDGAGLADNLRAVWHTGVDTMEPYHDFGRTFVQHALPAGSDASPFSRSSAAARELAVDLMHRAVQASSPAPPRRLAARLPELLWLLYLGVTLQWVADSSPDRARTRTLIDGMAPIVARTVSLARLPVAGGLVEDVLAVMTRLEALDGAAEATP